MASTSRPSATTWSPGCDPHEVAVDDVVDRDAVVSPSRTTLALGATSAAEPVERVLRAHLLRDADPSVRDQDGEEERVLPLAETQRARRRERIRLKT